MASRSHARGLPRSSLEAQVAVLSAAMSGRAVFGGFGALLIAGCLLARLLTLGSPALIDPSESRFAVAAMQMFESGDYITPKIFINSDDSQPYLAKPPLAPWSAAFAVSILGPSEFALRLPSFLANLLVVGCLALCALKFFGKSEAVVAPLIFLSTGGIFLFAFSSLTDPLVLGCYTAAMLGYLLSRESKTWGHLTFAALGLGMLAKGPVVIVLVGIAMLIDCLLKRSLRPLGTLPWVSGLVIFLLLWTPWYLVAERENPGFLEYYFFHENFLRYLVEDFGNQYGTSHVHTRGMIWLMYLGVLCPWTLLLPSVSKSLYRDPLARVELKKDATFISLLAFALSPLIFFTFARQIIATYCFPAIAPSALALAVILRRIWSAERFKKLVPAAAMFCMTYGAMLMLTAPEISARRSARTVLEYAREGGISRIGIYRQSPHSIHFYKDVPEFSSISIASALSVDKALAEKFEVLAVKRSDLFRIGTEESAHLKKRGDLGSWVFFTLVS